MKILEKALTQYGVKEILGKKNNPQIIKYFNETDLNIKNLSDETAWCSAFVNWVAKTSGYVYSGQLTARSWLKIGESIENPKPGDVVVLWRESPGSWKGHVGFYVRETRRYVYVLGGNQKNMVCIKAYPKSRLLDYRRLKQHG